MSFLKGLKIYLIGIWVPFLIKKRRDLVSMDLSRIIKDVREAVIDCLRGAIFVMLGNSIPFITLCYYPFNSRLIKNLPMTQKMPLIYTSLAPISLIVESPSKMPAYMGFFLAKSSSMLWRICRIRKIVPASLPCENIIAMALIAGVIGYISVK